MRFLAAAIVSFFLFFPSPVFAADYLLSPGKSLAIPDGVVNISPGDRFIVDVLDYRSYACEGVPVATDSLFAFDTEVAYETSESSGTFQADPIGLHSPPVTSRSGDGNSVAAARLSFFGPEFDGQYTLTVLTAKPGGENIRPLCQDTTFTGQYNTIAGPITFLELSNPGNKTINGRIIVFRYDKFFLHQYSFTLSSSERQDFDIHSIAPNTFGYMVILHDGPAGALEGSTAMYTVSNAAFILRGRIPIKPAP